MTNEPDKKPRMAKKRPSSQLQIPVALRTTGIFCRKKMPGLKSKGVEDTGQLVGAGSPAGLAVYPVEGCEISVYSVLNMEYKSELSTL